MARRRPRLHRFRGRPPFSARRHGCRRAFGGSPCAPAPRRRPGAGAGTSGPLRATPWYPAGAWSTASSSRPRPAQAPAASGPSGSLVRTTLFVSVLVLAMAALVYVLRYVLLVVNRNMLLNSWVARRSGLGGSGRQCGRDHRFDRVCRDADPVADRAAGRRVLALRVAGAPLRCGVVGRLPGAVRQSALGSGVRHRAGDDRRPLRPATRPIMLWWIAWIFSYVVSIFAIAYQLCHGLPGHRQQHRHDGVCLPVCGGSPSPPLLGSSKGSNASRSIGRAHRWAGHESGRTGRARICCSG